MERKGCYICHKEIKDNKKAINLTYETCNGEICNTYYLCGRKCFCKLADHLKDHEPEGITLINF